MYELNHGTDGKLNCIRRLKDGASIPICEGNRHYRVFVEWNSKQGVPLVLEDRAPDAPTQEEVEKKAESEKLTVLRIKAQGGTLSADDVSAAVEAWLKGGT